MALTGTPLINDIEDFRAIWQYLGWIDEKKPRPELMHALEETGLTPLDPGFFPAARSRVIDMGIVRRRKVDVAADIPARRIADLRVELGRRGRTLDPGGRGRARPAARLAYERAIEARDERTDGIDHDLVRRIAASEREDSSKSPRRTSSR